MFQNLLVAPLCNTSEVHDWHNRPFRTVWPEPPSHRTGRKGTDPEITKTIKRKPKRNRTAFTTEQLHGLEESFAACRYIEADGRRKLANTLKVGDKAIKIWFQNRRMKEKREENERDVDNCSSATRVSASDTLLHSPLSQMEFQHFNTENPTSYATDLPLLTEISPGYCVNTDYTSSFQKHYQEPNKSDCYNHGYCNFEAQQHISSYNVQDTFSASGSASFAYDGNDYPTHYYPNHDYFEGYTHTQPNHQAFYGDEYLSL